MRTFAVVLHYRRSWDTKACLASLARISSPPFSVLLIDNHSDDGSGDELREWIAGGGVRIGRDGWPKERLPTDNLPGGMTGTVSPCGRLLFLSSQENLGFAGGNNAGIRYALSNGADHVWLLNSDTVVTRGALAALLRTARAHEPVGAVQSLLLKRGSRRRVDASGQRITREGVRNDTALPSRAGPWDEGIPVFGACAASALYGAKALRDVGAFDEEFFIICEDVDLSFRLRLSGYPVFLSPRSVVFHGAGITTPSFAENPVKFYYGYRNEWVVALRYLSARWFLSPRAILHAVQAAVAGRRIGKRFLPFVLRNVPEAFRRRGEKRDLRAKWGAP